MSSCEKSRLSHSGEGNVATSFSKKHITQTLLAAMGGLLYREPGEEQIRKIVSSGLFDSTPSNQNDPLTEQGFALLAQWSKEASQSFDECLSSIKNDWLRLLVGYGSPAASPYESAYVRPDSLLFTPTTLEVRECYKRHGLEFSHIFKEPDDHIGLMLVFLSHLIGEEVQAHNDGNESQAHELMREQRDFLQKHILPWMPIWENAMLRHAKTDYYRGLAKASLGIVLAYGKTLGLTVKLRA